MTNGNIDDYEDEDEDHEGTEEMFEVDGGTEYQEVPMKPDTSSSETTGQPSHIDVDPIVKRKRRNRRKNKNKRKYKDCPPVEKGETEDLLMRIPRHIVVGPPVTDI